MARWTRALLVWGSLAWFVGCDSGPSGPGTLIATVNAGDALGAVTLEVVGAGVTGFEGVSTTQAFGSVVSARDGRHRVVLVDPVGGTLRFGIRVQDMGAPPPSITVVSAAGTDDLERITADVEARIEGR